MEFVNNLEMDLDNISALVKGREDSLSKTYRERVKSVKDSISSIELMIFGKKDVKGYFEQPETWMSYYQRASSFNYGKNASITQSQRLSYAELEQKTREVLNQMDAFNNNDWKNFKQFVKENPLSLFKE